MNATPIQARSAALRQAAQKRFDLVVIGGGATGCGVALDAVTRGLSVLLLEAGDYGGATSGASTKLVHGGVRYLEKAFTSFDIGQFRLVREALHERRHMLQNAPHLSNTLGIGLPVFSGWDRFYYRTGLRIYDWMAGAGRLQKSAYLNEEDFHQEFPFSKPGAGGILYYDGQFNDARYALALARTAEKAGAQLFNYCRVSEIAGREDEVELIAHNQLSGEAYHFFADGVINCTGAYADAIRKQLRDWAAPRLRPSRGTHIVLPKSALPISKGYLVPETSDGRVLFVLPWDRSILIGTTDEAARRPDNPYPTRQEVRFLLQEVNKFLQEPLREEQITAVFAGNRPLVTKDGTSDTAELIRDHEIEYWPECSALNVLGGKWTTYRLMAEEAVDKFLKMKPQPNLYNSQTRDYKLVGAESQPNHPALGKLGVETRRHLLQYGSEADTIAEKIDNNNETPLLKGHPYYPAEIDFHIEKAQAFSSLDILKNRLRIGVQDIPASLTLLPEINRRLTKWMNWSGQEQAADLEAAEQYFRQMTQVVDDLQPEPATAHEPVNEEA